MKKIIVVILAFGFLTACSSLEWYRPDTDIHRRKTDEAICWHRMEMAVYDEKIPNTRQAKLDDYVQCMESRGYKLIKKEMNQKPEPFRRGSIIWEGTDTGWGEK
jgi:hypothetical protein